MADYSALIRPRAKFFVMVVLLTFTITPGHCARLAKSTSTPTLSIEPKGSELEKAIGQSFVLTCQLQAEDPSVFSDITWLGPDSEETLVEEPGRKYLRQLFDGSNGVQLVFRELQEADTGVYHCRATSSDGHEPLTASVEVKSFMPITWVDAPEQQYATLGEKDAMIVCVVKASPVATVSWTRSDGQPISKEGDRFAIEDRGLKISEVQEEDEGMYTCTADVISTGEFEVRQIRFQVYSRPEFPDPQSPPEKAQGIEGEPLTIECHAKARPTPTYTWLDKDNNNLAEKEGYAVDAEKGTLQIHSLNRKQDEGPVTCVAQNLAENGRAEKNVRVVVLVKPEIVAMENKTAAVGSTVEIRCQASGNPIPQIIFYKLNSNEEKEFTNGVQPNDPRINVHQEGDSDVATLTITDVTRADDGLYKCTALNDGGDAHVNGHLEVQFPPSFDTENLPKFQHSWEDNPVNLTCVVESIPNATIKWFHGQEMVEITGSGQGRHLKVFGNGPVSVLEVTPTDASHFTTYTCRAQNVLGEAEYSVNLTEAHPPGQIPEALVVEEESTADSVTFDFVEPEEIEGLEIDAYLVQYRRSAESWEEAKKRLWTRGSSYILQDLEPQETYVFRFAARNPVGTGEWSGEVSRTMPQEGPPLQPTIVDHGAAVGSDIEDTGEGPMPDDVVIQSPYPDRYELKWQAPPGNGRPIDFFEIVYYKVVQGNSVDSESTDGWVHQDDQKQNKTRPFSGATHMAMPLTGLDQGSFYRVEIRAHNSLGYSEPGVAVFKTFKIEDHHLGDITKDQSTGDAPSSSSIGENDEGADDTFNFIMIGVIAAIGVILLIVIVDVVRCRRRRGVIYFASERCSGKFHGGKEYALTNEKCDKEPKIVSSDAKLTKTSPTAESSAETAPMIPESEEKTNGAGVTNDGQAGIRSSIV